MRKAGGEGIGEGWLRGLRGGVSEEEGVMEERGGQRGNPHIRDGCGYGGCDIGG